MNALRLLALSALAVTVSGLGGRAAERESNFWPVSVSQAGDAGHPPAWNGAGPFLFRQPAVDGSRFSGFRPFFVQSRETDGEFRAAYILYPVFSYHEDAETYRWSFFELIRRTDRRPGAGVPSSVFTERGEFEIWPFWFSRRTGDPAMSYRGLFPVAGTIKNKLSFERATWVLFPLYAQSEKRGAVTTFVPWPFIRVTRGAAHGFGLWPLYTFQERPGVSRDTYFLWPFGYDHVKAPAEDAPPGTPPRHDHGFLPFYARSTGPGYFDMNVIWPFFGYTDRMAPTPYHETRYFWPFLVQGRGGDNLYVNRWGPFYTHSIINGYDKTWYLWPLVRHAEWAEPERGLKRAKTQLFYFLYWSEVQRSLQRPDMPAARLTHVWPLVSSWDNGAGRRQWQAPSPFEVFFPGNEKWRQTWSALFTLIRYDQRAPGEERTSLLWDAITWERRESEAHTEFHLGPLLSVTTDAADKRVAVGHGLFGFRRRASGGWGMFWLDFSSKTATNSASRPALAASR